jgi:hypothetical protein
MDLDDDAWLEDEDAPGAERARREREFQRLANRMASLGFSDGVDAGQEAALQDAFDRGYCEGYAGVDCAAVRATSVLATFAEFYARHGAALGVPVSIAALVFSGAPPKLPRDDILDRFVRLLGDGGAAAPGLSGAELWAQLLGWADAGAAEFTQGQLDMAVNAAISSAGPSLRSAHEPILAAARDGHAHSGCG